MKNDCLFDTFAAKAQKGLFLNIKCWWGDIKSRFILKCRLYIKYRLYIKRKLYIKRRSEGGSVLEWAEFMIFVKLLG